jgi:hypothetical protein
MLRCWGMDVGKSDDAERRQREVRRVRECDNKGEMQWEGGGMRRQVTAVRGSRGQDQGEKVR